MYGWTPLHFAAASGHLQVTNMKDYWGYNPLDLAIKFDHLHVKKHLEEVGYISNEINPGFGVWAVLLPSSFENESIS
jgi:ankyrin repeat protein